MCQERAWDSPYFVQGTEIIDNVIFSMMHYLLFYMYPSNDDTALVRVRPKRNGFEHLMVVCSKANVMRMTISASGYFCTKERKVMDYSLK